MPCRFRDIGSQLATNCRGTTRDEPSLGINIDQIEKPFMALRLRLLEARVGQLSLAPG
jgi:hypothetical protein